MKPIATNPACVRAITGKNLFHRVNTIAGLLFAIFLSLSACTKDEQISPKPAATLSITPSSIVTPFSAGQASTVRIITNSEWQISVPPSANWLEIDKTSGGATTDVTIRITKANTTGTNRVAVISVTVNKAEAEPRQIIVEQKKENQ